MSFDVTVAREQFVEGLRPFARLGRRRLVSDAVVVKSGDYLKVICSNISTRLPATGFWPGEVFVSGKAIVALAKAPPTTDPVRLYVKEDRLVIGTLSVPCEFTESAQPDEEFVLGAEGLAGPVQRAQASLVKKAAKLLEPLGVVESDLQRLVSEAQVRGDPSSASRKGR